MDLSTKDAKYFYNLKKGSEGETRFDEYLEAVPGNWLTLNDLGLESNNDYFQVDTSLLFQGIIPQKTIRRILLKNFKHTGHSSSFYFIID
jgi:hypothetical protein